MEANILPMSPSKFFLAIYMPNTAISASSSTMSPQKRMVVPLPRLGGTSSYSSSPVLFVVFVEVVFRVMAREFAAAFCRLDGLVFLFVFVFVIVFVVVELVGGEGCALSAAARICAAGRKPAPADSGSAAMRWPQ